MSQLVNLSQPHVEPFLSVDFRSIRLTPQQFELLCRDNPDVRMELTSKGELIVMSPTGSKSGMRNSILVRSVANWASRDGTGISFDSSAGFTLPNGAIRSPDVAWVRRERWESLGEEEQEGFAPLCPDFVVELRSPTDRVADIQGKMNEYVENGAQLGVLIDPFDHKAYIYRPGRKVEVLDRPEHISADPELPKLLLELNELWR